jgi:hypothetical protein
MWLWTSNLTFNLSLQSCKRGKEMCYIRPCFQQEWIDTHVSQIPSLLLSQFALRYIYCRYKLSFLWTTLILFSQVVSSLQVFRIIFVFMYRLPVTYPPCPILLALVTRNTPFKSLNQKHQMHDFFTMTYALKLKQEVLERTDLPTFLTLFKNVICIKTSVCPNTTLVGNSVPILKHSHVQNNVSNKRILGSSWSFTILNFNCVGITANSFIREVAILL